MPFTGYDPKASTEQFDSGSWSIDIGGSTIGYLWCKKVTSTLYKEYFVTEQNYAPPFGQAVTFTPMPNQPFTDAKLFYCWAKDQLTGTVASVVISADYDTSWSETCS